MLTTRYKTDMLFPRTSFLTGMGAVLNIAGNYFEFNYAETGDDADAKAIESDWGITGQDIEDTVKKNPADKFLLAFNQ